MSGRRAFLVWVSSFGRPSPQVIFDCVGSRPFIDEGIKGRVLSTYELQVDDAHLPLSDLVLRFPAPALKQAEDGK